MPDPTTELAAYLTQGQGWTPPPPLTNLLVGDPNGGNAFISDVLTAELTAYYTSGPGGTGISLAQAMVQFNAASDDYTYYVWGYLLDGSDTLPFFASGGVNLYGVGNTSSNVREYYRATGPDEVTKAVTFAFGSVDGSDNGVPYTAPFNLSYGAIGVAYDSTLVTYVEAQIDYDARTLRTFNGIEGPRGIPGVNANGSGMDILSTGSVVPVGGVETSILAIPSATYLDGHAYEVAFFCNYQAFVTSARPAFALRQTGSGGTLITDFGELPVPVAGRKYAVGGTLKFVNRSGHNVTDFIVLTLRDNAATGNNVQAVPPAGGGVGWLGPAMDIGASVNYVNPTNTTALPTVS